MTIKIGLIGCGIVTQKAHIPAIIKDQRFRITALCRRDLSKLDNLINQFPNAKVYAKAEDLIKSKDVDCILIAADASEHLSLAKIVLDNNKYALIEKPIASSPKDIKKFIDSNQKNLNKLMVAFNKRFYPGIVKLKELSKSGEISKIIGGTISFSTKQSRKPGKLGVLQNLIHSCDLACHIFGKPKQVSAHFSKVINDDVKGKTIAVTITTENGAVVNIFFTSSSNWNLPIHERFEVFDDKTNNYYFEDADKIIFSKSSDNKTITTIFKDSNSIFWKYNPFGYESQISHFGDLVEGKIKAPTCTIQEALIAHELFEEIFKHDK